jgi:SAM-dependent methyltransferase
MSEYYGGYMYASAAPLPNIYYRRPKTSSSSPTSTSTPARANSTSKAQKSKSKTSRFGHQRTSSSSETSRSSHETSLRLQTSAESTHHPAASGQQQTGTASERTLASPSSTGSTNKHLPPSSHSDSAASTANPSASTSSSKHHHTSFFHGKLAATTGALYSPLPRLSFSAAELKHVAMLSEAEATKLSKISVPFSRTDSVSSASGTTSLRSGGTMTSSDPTSSLEGGVPASKPYTLRNGRTYLNDATLTYPLPVDLTELHRQSMRTLLLIQVFGGPVCSPSFATRPPVRVLEVGCGSGFWSMMCHRYFAQRGHNSISFTGIDIGPMAPGSAGPTSEGGGVGSGAKPDRDMRWKFVQHDMRQMPWPLEDEQYDLIMVKDVSLATTNTMQQKWVDEYVRLLRPNGTLEIWEGDHTVRMLRPHATGSGSGTGDDDEEHDAAASLGAYVMTANTPLSSPLNNFLVEYNSWLLRALESRDLSAVPCTLIGPMLLQESDTLCDVRSRRLAIPLSEARWEREDVSGVVTKDGKSYIETGKGKARDNSAEGSAGKKTLSVGQAALRRTALQTVVQLVQALEPLLRETSGKSQDEWDAWLGKMMNDLVKENGTSWGECLEVGAWWAKKRRSTS